MVDEVQLAAKQAEDKARLWQMHDYLKSEAERMQEQDQQMGREFAALVGEAAAVLAEIRAGSEVEPELAGLLCRALDADDLWRRLHKLPRREGYLRARMQLSAYYADCRARAELRELFRAGAVQLDVAGQLDAAWVEQVQEFLKHGLADAVEALPPLITTSTLEVKS